MSLLLNQMDFFMVGVFLFGLVLLITLVVVEIRKRKQWKEYLDYKSSAKKITKKERSLQFFSQYIRSDSNEIKKKFVSAGFYHTQLAMFYMPAKYALFLLGAIGLYFYAPLLGLDEQITIVLGLVWLVVVLIFPDGFLALRSKALRASLSNKLPYLIDLMAVCVQTGMTIESAFDYLAKEMKSFDKDLSYMLTKTNERSRVVGLEVALEELYQRVPTPEIRSFVMTLNQSLQYGTSIYQVLGTLSSDIREVQMLGIEEKIGKLAAKMSAPLILFIMLPIVILIAAPGVMRMMSNA